MLTIEIMSFVDKFLSKEKEPEYFLMLKVGNHTFEALIWEVKGNKILILGRGISNIDDSKDFTQAADEAISTAEKGLPSGKLVEKVIFGLPYEYTHANKIKPEILTKLKTLTTELSLKPLGFIELPEAIANYLQKKENSPPSAILLGVDKESLTISLLRVGKIQENLVFKRGEYFAQDTEKALKNLTGIDVLPSKILIYDENENLEKLTEELIKHPWHNRAAFLHFPKIESLDDDEILDALIESAASEIIKTESNEDLDHNDAQTPVKNPSLQPKEEVVGVDNIEAVDEAAVFGFQKDKDVQLETEAEEVDEQEEEPENNEKRKIRLPSIPLALPSFSSLKIPRLPKLKFIPLIILLVLIFIIGGIGSYAYYQLPQANVRLLVGTQKMQKDIDITFSPNTTSVDKSALVIPANKIELDVDGEDKASTTGKKNVGNPARGTVTIYNKTTSSKTLDKGTVLTAKNLKFTLDSDVTIASASDTGEGLTYGKTDAKITASSIGPEGNISSGNTFTFSDSSFNGKNNDSLSGGTSRTVSVVSKEDQDKLLEDLSKSLIARAKDDLYKKSSGDEKILDESVKINIVSKKFDKNVDSEATSFSLKLTAKVEALTYNKEDLNTLAREVLVDNMPPDFEFASEGTKLSIQEIELQKDNSLKAKAIVASSLLPKIDVDKIQIELAGKSLAKAQEMLRNEKNIVGVEFQIDNPLPIGGDKLPLKSSNIHLTIASSN